MNAMPLSSRRSLALGALGLAAAGSALMPAAPRSAARWIDDLCTTLGRPMFASAPAPAGSAARPATLVKPLSCEPLPNVPGKSQTTVLVEFPPLAYSPAHRHPGSVTAVIIEGTVRSQLQGTPAQDYQAGQSFFEPPGTLHVFAENPDPSRSAKLLAFFVTDENCGPLTIYE
ncbi:cupin domain-containing protein [Variovorax sp. JS1663]|uniref:cupin domain-containing protein n=1 Tax=Variovorax sp. JS1663 TaxID=1851577 RepID=UPI000B347EF6|nr:cupin domain-containing protein [Variovorax sp. JS1663]OUM02155.1 cupin [Variovorax sp. JS1663]